MRVAARQAKLTNDMPEVKTCIEVIVLEGLHQHGSGIHDDRKGWPKATPDVKKTSEDISPVIVRFGHPLHMWLQDPPLQPSLCSMNAVLTLTDGKPSFPVNTYEKVLQLKDKHVELFLAPVTELRVRSLHS